MGIRRWLNWAERPIRSHKQGTNKRASGKRVNAKSPNTGLYNSTHSTRPKVKGSRHPAWQLDYGNGPRGRVFTDYNKASMFAASERNILRNPKVHPVKVRG